MIGESGDQIPAAANSSAPPTRRRTVREFASNLQVQAPKENVMPTARIVDVTAVDDELSTRRRNVMCTLHPLATPSADRDITGRPPFTAAASNSRSPQSSRPWPRRYRGWPITTITHILTRSWQQAFGAPLTEPGLSWCAQAIHTGSPWQHALWVGPNS
jgi:hypothetical protein